MPYKTLPFFLKDLDLKTRLVTGIFAVHGHVDDGHDVSEPGSFAKRLGDGSRLRARFLWNHRSWDPPIASIKFIREVGREKLPEEVLKWAPEATGGVEVGRKYYEGIELAEWVFKAVQEKDVTEMSYQYEVHEYAIKRADDPGQRDIRVLKDLELFDISDVNWGMNDATSAVKHWGVQTDIQRLRMLLTELKEGRVLSSSNREKVSSAVGAMETAITALTDLLSASEPSKGLPETGETLSEHSARLVASLEELLGRVQDRKSFRESEGRSLSSAMRDRLTQMTTEIGVLLRETEPKAAPNQSASLERRLRAAGLLLASTKN